jgi:hypothetical protein
MNSAQNLDAIRALENQVFYGTAGKSYRSVMFTPDAILLFSDKPDDANEFRETFEKASAKTLTLTQTLTIPYAEILRFRHQSGSDVMHLKYNGLKITWPGEIDLDNGETDVHNIFNYLEKVKGYQRSETQLTSMKAVLPNLVYIAICVGFTWLLYSMATGEMSTGSGSGRARAKAEIFKALADFLGPVGCLLLGLVATSIAVWFFWKKYSNPPVETRLE